MGSGLFQSEKCLTAELPPLSAARLHSSTVGGQTMLLIPLLEVKCLPKGLDIIHNDSPDLLLPPHGFKPAVFQPQTERPCKVCRSAAWRVAVTDMWSWCFLVLTPPLGPLLASCATLMSSQLVSRITFICRFLHFQSITYTTITQFNLSWAWLQTYDWNYNS